MRLSLPVILFGLNMLVGVVNLLLWLITSSVVSRPVVDTFVHNLTSAGVLCSIVFLAFTVGFACAVYRNNKIS